jgi:broad-specificity NMP kinase
MKEKRPFEKGGEFRRLVELAWKLDKRINKNVSRQFVNLVEAENGTGMKRIGSFEKQLKEIKETLEKVFNIFLRHEVDNKKRRNIESCLGIVHSVINSEQIYSIVVIGLKNAFQDFR